MRDVQEQLYLQYQHLRHPQNYYALMHKKERKDSMDKQHDETNMPNLIKIERDLPK